MTPAEAAVILHRDIRPLTLTVDEATAVTMAYEALIALVPRPLTVREAAQALVEKLALIHADERYIAVWMHSCQRIGQYTGPNYITELDALRVALAKDSTP